MQRVRPRSPSAKEDSESWWAPQPPVSNPAKRRCLQEPERPESLAQPDLEAPEPPTGGEITSVVVVPEGYNFQLHLDDFDLLMRPEPNSVLQVSHQGHNIVLIPEGLQSSSHLGQPGFLARPEGAAPLDLPPEQLYLILPGSFSASGSHRECLENASNTHQDPQTAFLMPWRSAPAGMAAGLLLSYPGVSSPLFPSQAPQSWSPSASPSAERYAPGSIWSLQSSMLWPLPGSPLQPLPPSPPDPQAQHLQKPQKPSRPRCKAQRRLF